MENQMGRRGIVDAMTFCANSVLPIFSSIRTTLVRASGAGWTSSRPLSQGKIATLGDPARKKFRAASLDPEHDPVSHIAVRKFIRCQRQDPAVPPTLAGLAIHPRAASRRH
jgi:hypothetical protein